MYVCNKCNKCAPYHDVQRGVQEKCDNIRDINLGFVSCKLYYMVIFYPGKPFPLHIKKKYRMQHVEKTSAQRLLFPS